MENRCQFRRDCSKPSVHGPPRHPAHRDCPAQPDGGRRRRQPRQGARGARRGTPARGGGARADAASQGADLVLYTELYLAGYPPEDLVLKPAFLAACGRAALDFAADTADGGPGVIVGTPLKRQSGTHNAVVVGDGGKVLAERFKVDL